jgi:2,3-dihydroxybenzoate-AMP ligase
VVPKAGWRIDLADLRKYLNSQGLARFKLPEHLVLLDRLPLTPVGKVDKVALRQRFAETTVHA